RKKRTSRAAPARIFRAFCGPLLDFRPRRENLAIFLNLNRIPLARRASNLPRRRSQLSQVPMIAVQNLRKSYGATVAVDGASFEVRPGETFGLLGPNGAGKSTTIGIMIGVLHADSGSVAVNGGPPTDPRV